MNFTKSVLVLGLVFGMSVSAHAGISLGGSGAVKPVGEYAQLDLELKDFCKQVRGADFSHIIVTLVNQKGKKIQHIIYNHADGPTLEDAFFANDLYANLGSGFQVVNMVAKAHYMGTGVPATSITSLAHSQSFYLTGTAGAAVIGSPVTKTTISFVDDMVAQGQAAVACTESY